MFSAIPERTIIPDCHFGIKYRGNGGEEDDIATQAPGGLDFETPRTAIEERDADAAEIHTVNKNTTPSSPQVLRGKEEISEYLREVCGREMTHYVENEVVGENRISFYEACEYPDGTRVLGAEALEVRDGKIVHQVNVEAWDE
jgi:hypothetical protein